MTDMTPDKLAAIKARLAAAESSHISAPLIDGRHIYSPRQARIDISALIAEVERWQGITHCLTQEIEELRRE